jgi:hypothetical protein
MIHEAAHACGIPRLSMFARCCGRRYNQFGDHPDDYLTYIADGRMHAIPSRRHLVEPGLDRHRSVLVWKR